MRIVRFRDPQDGRIVSGVLDGEEILVQGRRRALRGVTLEAPCAPTKLVCVGRNYAAHAQEYAHLKTTIGTILVAANFLINIQISNFDPGC